MTDTMFDPAAPYGRKPNGEPYRVPEERRIQLGERLKDARAAKTSAARVPGVSGWGPPPPVTRATSGKSTAKVSPNVAAVMGMLALPLVALSLASRFNPTFALDSVALRMHSPAIAVAVDDVARESDRVQAFLDGAGKAVPGMAILGAVLPLGMQIAANHGFMQPVPEMGVLAPLDLLKAGGVTVVDQQPAPAEPAAGSADVPAF